MKNLGKTVKELRIQRGFSADKLAEKIGKKGANRSQYVYDLEKDKVKRVDLRTIKSLANALGVNPGVLLDGGTVDENENQAIFEVIKPEVDYQEKYIKLLEDYKKLQQKLIEVLENKSDS